MLRLGVNVDHVATVRNARGSAHPCPVHAAQLAARAGANGITAHLREDRRHIRDTDIFRLRNEISLPLNFEMAATEEMQRIALEVKPNAVCLVPEKREELTTEGGLKVANAEEKLTAYIAPLKSAGIRISLFIEADAAQIEAARHIGADIVELHTGAYAEAKGAAQKQHLLRIQKGAVQAHSLGLEVHAGHGLTYENVGAIAAMPELAELNIGHFLIGEAIYGGLPAAIMLMRVRMNEARA